MMRLPPRSTRTGTLCTYTTFFRSHVGAPHVLTLVVDAASPTGGRQVDPHGGGVRGPGRGVVGPHVAHGRRQAAGEEGRDALPEEQVDGRVVAEIGRAHVCTPVTNAHLVCRLLLETKTPDTQP